MLGRLANLPAFDDPTWSDKAAQFVKDYEPLRSHPEVDPKDIEAGSPYIERLQEQEVIQYAQRFREAWALQEAKTEEEQNFKIQVVNGYLDEIFGFASSDPISGDRPIVKANFGAGTFEPKPRNLLEVLALQLMSDRSMLHRCERPECRRYFVKNFSRDRYCKFLRQWERELDRIAKCAEVMRRRGQELSAERNRDRINRRRRKPRGKGEK